VLLLTRIIGIRIWVMGQPRLEVVHIGYMLNRRGKWVPNFAIFSHMIKGTTSMIGKGWGT